MLNLINQINDFLNPTFMQEQKEKCFSSGGSCETAIGGLAEIENDN